ncbi:MAG: hypothetical protein WCD04_13580 [Terriglobia bacterium]
MAAPTDYKISAAYFADSDPRVKLAHRAFHFNWVAIQVGNVYYFD